MAALASRAMAAGGLRVTEPGTGESLAVRTALSAGGAREFLSMIEEDFVTFVTFGPLGTVTLIMVGAPVR
ncbi:hypothetical protein [Streptomyces sp. Isolate_219]|uniref:hypothetical protein n=1 Tax=Streptomyces sp. Isolate_219 TaxID=2950110 RepID=UPI0021C611C8|nr:hypothetical protein [Streptomyces sp. Isolate_219]MCR8573892.1 hypothetical protein [Streptomyces sp. Isolate_219]